MRRVYLDHAATTAVHPQVLQTMLPYLQDQFGNPSSIYSWGREAKAAIENARAQVAALINADPAEIIFTGSGTEADNTALVGVASALGHKGRHIITSKIEHHAILHTAEDLEQKGFQVTYLPVDGDGLVDPEDLKKALTPETILVSIMFANNEIGTIEPIGQLAQIAKEHGVLFHTDAVQAVGNVPVDVKELGVDLLSLSGHKIYAPKGVGALYVRRGTKIKPFIHGGAQERKFRAGTENVPGIVGLGKAAELARLELPERRAHLIELRDYLIEGVLGSIDHVRLNGHRTCRLPGNANFSFEFVEGESLLLSLDLAGIAASSGSACTSGSLEPSHVLLAIGLPHEIAHGSLRLTLGRENTKEDIDYVLSVLPDIVNRLRAMSPLAPKGGLSCV
ncbi:MAG: cysteine desulfurase NifS [Firmicutes bacterium]|nr:cysteine desulfurase NifS [Bacillota bacterium]